MAYTAEQRAARLEELRKAREEKAAQMAAERLNTRAAAVEAAAVKEVGGVTPVTAQSTVAERVEALKDIRAAENLATYSAGTEFKAIPFSQLNQSTKGVIAANAAATGVTPEEYYKMRGGVNASGYYGDSYTPGLTLTERQYEIARQQGSGEAINLASQKQAYEYYQSQGDNPVLAAIKSGYTGVGLQVKPNAAPGGGNLYLYSGKYYDEAGVEVTNGQSLWNASNVSSTTVNANSSFNPSASNTAGLVITTANTAANTVASNVMTASQEDVYSIMVARLNQYNLGALAPLIRDLAIKGATEATIMLQLSEEPLYKERFKANETRKQKGLSVLTPSQYLSLEDDYRQVLRAYGLTQFDNDAYVSQFLANDVSVSELSNRVVTAVQRVRNADPAVSSMLKNLYGIGQNDLVAYVLDPEQQFQKIERQVAASEISVAAARQGFDIGATVAEQLAAQGISQAEAQRGYSTIADILPTAEKLSDIYGGVEEQYRLPEAEQEVFNQLASAQRKRQRLVSRETAAFSGASGLGRTSLTEATGGQF
jgi:hypothetical protein